jgi:hypothetical protein
MHARLAVACALCALAGHAAATPPGAAGAIAPPDAAAPIDAPAPADAPASAPAYLLPAGATLGFTLERALDTREAERGERFALALADAPCIDGRTLAPGPRSEARVVHVQRGGIFGKPAELTLATEPLAVGDAVLALRAATPSTRGRSRERAGITTAVFTGPFAAFVRGGNITLPVGTAIDATLRSATPIAPAHLVACSADAAPQADEVHASDPPATGAGTVPPGDTPRATPVDAASHDDTAKEP